MKRLCAMAKRKHKCKFEDYVAVRSEFTSEESGIKYDGCYVSYCKCGAVSITEPTVFVPLATVPEGLTAF